MAMHICYDIITVVFRIIVVMRTPAPWYFGGIMKKNSYKEICFSIIGSLICIFFIEPFLKLLGKGIFYITDKLFKSVSNSLYISVGQERYDFDFITAVFIFLLLFFLMLLLYLKNILDSKYLLDKTDDFIYKIKN